MNYFKRVGLKQLQEIYLFTLYYTITLSQKQISRLQRGPGIVLGHFRTVKVTSFLGCYFVFGVWILSSYLKWMEGQNDMEVFHLTTDLNLN